MSEWDCDIATQGPLIPGRASQAALDRGTLGGSYDGRKASGKDFQRFV